MKFKYGIFNNQNIPTYFPEVPVLASVFRQTPYYFCISSSYFCDLRVPSDFQSFTPYLNFPISRYSFRNSQCFVSIKRKGHWRLSPWFRIDPKFGSKYMRLYICYVIQRNYLWLNFNQYYTKLLPNSIINLFDLAYSIFFANPVINSTDRIRNPYLGVILDPMTEFNLKTFGKSRKKSIRWPYNNFISHFLKHFFTSPKTRRYQSIAANGVVGPYVIAYLFSKSQMVIHKVGSWSQTRKEVKARLLKQSRSKIFFFNKYIYSYHKLKRFKQQLSNYHPRFRMLFTSARAPVNLEKIYLAYIALSRMTREIQAQYLYVKIKSRYGVPQLHFYRGMTRHTVFRRYGKRFRLILVYSKTFRQEAVDYRRDLTPILGPLASWLAPELELNNSKYYKAVLQTRFVKLYIRIISFLNFIDKYWTKFFRFPIFVKSSKNQIIQQKLTKFIRRWFKLRLSRRLFRRQVKKPIFKGFQLIRKRIRSQFFYLLSQLRRFDAQSVFFEDNVLESISNINIISACIKWSNRYTRSRIYSLLRFNQNYHYLANFVFGFGKTANWVIPVFGSNVLIFTNHLNCLILSTSPVSGLLMFSGHKYFSNPRSPKLKKFVGQFIRPSCRGLWMFRFINTT